MEEGDVQVGHHIRAKVQKNKKAPPYRQAEFAIKYTQGIVNKNVEVRDLGVSYGIIERPNNVSYILDGVNYKGKDAIANALLEPTLQASVLQRVKDAKLTWIPPVNIVEIPEAIEESELTGYEDASEE